jgi:general secretion pathway protein K
LNRARRQRGIALLTAVILVALATMLAVAIGFSTAMTARRTASSFTVEQGLQFAAAAEAIAAYALREDLNPTVGTPRPASQQDHPAERWAQAFPPAELAADVIVEAKLDDESGKFNLNSLINDEGKIDDESFEVFTQLLQFVDPDPRWAPLVADWIDSDPMANTNGGEDDLYTRQTPAHRAANLWITSPAELMVIPGFGRELYEKLLPHVTALPPQARQINVCFASPELLDAIESVYAKSQIRTWTPTQARKQLISDRASRCTPTIGILQASGGQRPPRPLLDAKLTNQSTFFKLRTWVSIGTTRFALYSLIERTGSNASEVHIVSRTFGTE